VFARRLIGPTLWSVISSARGAGAAPARIT